MARPALKRMAVDYLMSTYTISQRRACQLMKQSRRVQVYRSIKDPRDDVRLRMRQICGVRVRYGYRRVHVLLKREGCRIGISAMKRLYQQEGLTLRKRLPRRRKSVVTRMERFVPARAGQAWAMDFVSDQLVSGHKLRALTIIDVFSREALAIEVGSRLRAEDVIRVCNALARRHGAPSRVFVDNGSEFTGRMMDLWAHHHRVQLDFSRPGKPTDNAFIETFNGSLRDECLNVHWFESLDDARAKIEAWRRDYNESRPHQALKGKSPSENARLARSSETA